MLKKIVLAILVLGSQTSCSTSTEDRGDVGGGRRFTVVCRDEVQDCYERCRELCPNGYLVSNRVRGRKIDDDVVEYRAVIICKPKRLRP